LALNFPIFFLEFKQILSNTSKENWKFPNADFSIWENSPNVLEKKNVENLFI